MPHDRITENPAMEGAAVRKQIFRYALVYFIPLFTITASASPPANDAFTNSVQLTSTNFSYTGNFTAATLESGEPLLAASNTVWMSWVAPDDGSVQVGMASAPQFQTWMLYTGPAVDRLQHVFMVPGYMNSLYRFVAAKGTVYHFQFAGGADDFTFNLSFQAFGPCANDNFDDAQIVKGRVIYFDAKTVVKATLEVGEPAHMGPVPQKSIWWKWQAPEWGYYYFDARSSLASNYVISVYTGSSVETLTLLKKATNDYFRFWATGGETYSIAAAVPTNTIGDIQNYLQISITDNSPHSVPGNLLKEPSWEGTSIWNSQYWHVSGSLGGYVNARGGVDGTTWPVLATGIQIWQDFPTIPGHVYAIKFAYQPNGGSGDTQVAVAWDANQVGVSTIPGDDPGCWHWCTYTALATNTTSRLTFQNLARDVAMDAFSVVDCSAPPAIVIPPASSSTISGGTVAFTVGVTGTSPLVYQWCFNGTPLPGQTNKLLVLTSLTTNHMGNYHVIVANSFGTVTSTVASLLVDAPTNTRLLAQPYGGTVPVPGYFNFSVVADGTPPLTYQWFLNNLEISTATNRNLMFTNVQPADAGRYTVRVQNPSSTVWSLPATLTVSTTDTGGGTINFRNRFLPSDMIANAPVFDLDGVTALNGSNYVAQLYAGPSLALLRPVGQPTPFLEGFNAGYFLPQMITLANVAPTSNAVVQVRAWDTAFGTSFEEARQLGGRFGKSQIIQVPTTGGLMLPAPLPGLQSFNLQAGLPYLQVASIQFVQWQPPNIFIWALHGQAGNLYVIEKSEPANTTIWRPLAVVTNSTGTVNFSDTSDSPSNVSIYRARILD